MKEKSWVRRNCDRMVSWQPVRGMEEKKMAEEARKKVSEERV